MSDDRRLDGLKMLQNPFCDPEQESRHAAAAPVDPVLARLLDFVHCHDRVETRTLVDELMQAGIDPVALTEDYIPATALALGDEWCADAIDFARVTIGSARLQGLLRELTIDWCAEASPSPDGPTILVVTLPERTHTLGAMVMAATLRRHGCSVRLALGLGRADIAAKIRAVPFDAVFISASLSEDVQDVAAVARLSKSAKSALPVVVGGSILEKQCDILRAEGADHLTRDVDEALTLCGLRNRTTTAARDRT